MKSLLRMHSTCLIISRDGWHFSCTSSQNVRLSGECQVVNEGDFQVEGIPGSSKLSPQPMGLVPRHSRPIHQPGLNTSDAQLLPWRAAVNAAFSSNQYPLSSCLYSTMPGREGERERRRDGERRRERTTVCRSDGLRISTRPLAVPKTRMIICIFPAQVPFL